MKLKSEKAIIENKEKYSIFFKDKSDFKNRCGER